MQNTKVIFTKRLADYLVKKGFKCIDTQINYKDPKLFVFLFEKTPELDLVVDEFIKKCRTERGG